jgi:hypothetical protein
MSHIDETGFHRTTKAEYLANLKAGYRGIYGADINLDPDTADGQRLDKEASLLDELAQTLEDVYNGRSPAGAIGAALARLVGINGVTKKGPLFTTTSVVLGGIPGTVIPAGSLVGASSNATIKVQTTADATIGGGSVSPAVPVAALVYGAIVIPAGTLDTPLTVISGWTTVAQAADAAVGTTGETDAALRARRAASVALPSQAILDGLEAAILQITNVGQARVRENPADTTQTLADGGSLVAHAIEAMCLPPDGGSFSSEDLKAIAQVIWLKRSLGVTMVGGHTEVITDSQGVDHDISFDIPGAGIVLKPIYVEIHTATPLSSGDQDAVAQAIEARGRGLLKVNGVPLPGSKISEAVAASDVYDAITFLKLTTMPQLKVSKVLIGLTAWPTVEDDIPLAYNEIAAWGATVDPDVGAQIKFVSP